MMNSFLRFISREIAVPCAALSLASYTSVCTANDLLILFPSLLTTFHTYVPPLAGGFYERIQDLCRHPKCLDEKHCGADGAVLVGILSDRMMECDIHHANQYHHRQTYIMLDFLL